MKKSSTLLCALIIAMNGFATVYRVPADYSTIQSALNACNTGDTVMVDPGTYVENINWPLANSIKLISTGDASNTIIDGNAAGGVIEMSFGNFLDTTTVVRGFTITNGKVAGTFAQGAGVDINSRGAVFENDVITANHCISNYYGFSAGGGIYSNHAMVVFRNTEISNNVVDSGGAQGAGISCSNNSTMWLDHSSVTGNSLHSDDWGEGGGIYVSASTLQLLNVSVSGNQVSCGGYLNNCEGFGIYCYYGNVTLTNVLINGNSALDGAEYYVGFGFSCLGTSATFTNVLINGNIAGSGGENYGGGLNITYYAVVNGMNLTVTDNHSSDYSSIHGSGAYVANSEFDAVNSILWNVNPGLDVDSDYAIPNISYSDVRGGYDGTGNIDTLPGFVSASDFHLQTASPCINAGTLNGAPNFDLDNNPRPSPAFTNPDMGCFERDQSLIGCAADFYLVADTLAPHHYWAVNQATGSGTLSYIWSWGDGTYDSTAYPSHTYANAGFYTICLSIQDSTGCFDSVCINYDVQKLSSENTIVTVDVVANIPTYIQNLNFLQSWSVFPNPASGKSFINYSLSTRAAVRVELYDVLGNKLKQLINADEDAGEHNASFDASKLANGVYLLQIDAGNQMQSQKIVILH